MSFYKIKSKLLQILGDIKIIPMPLFLYYQKGDYYRISGTQTQEILSIIQPGDVLARGYYSYLDNMFIPGKYSHTGVYIGDGKVIHAVAQGVTQTSLIDFCRCDKICVMRPVSGQQLAINRVKSVLGKPYDFSFKQDNNAFYCHELTAYAYKELKPAKVIPYLGFLRFCTMQPTYLAQSFTNNPNFKVVYSA